MNMIKEPSFIKQKTIASIVTPLGEGGISKIIVSGTYALDVVNAVFKGKGIADLRGAASHKLYYGHIHDKGQKIDEVIVNIIKQTDSFTGEDVVEVNCHGGIRALMRVYECLQTAGAEGVEWDLLLLQSFENKKMDFVQKEALQELVQARTKLGVKVLLDQYAGALSRTLKEGLGIIEGIRQSLLTKGNENSLSLLPSSQGREEGDNLSASVSILANFVGSLLKLASFGIALTSPQVLVILGKPNVGKSTLINAILGEERMLVHHEPGTTRDYVSEFISIEGVPFEMVDTAGVRQTSNRLEVMSIEMTQEQLQRADKVIAVFDNSRNFDREDDEILSASNSWLKTKNAGYLQQGISAHPLIPVINKCDLPAKLDRQRVESALQQPVCCISAMNKEGFGNLNKRLIREFDTTYKPMEPVLFNKRQCLLLAKADMLIKQEKDFLTAKNASDRTFQALAELKNIFTTCLKGG